MTISSFEDIQRETLINAGCGYCLSTNEKSYVSKHRGKLKQIIASGTIVIEKNGIKWAQDNPEDFAKSAISNLGFWLKLALFVGGLFLGGSSLWITLAKFILPFLIDIFIKQAAFGVCGVGAGDEKVSSFADGAREFLSGSPARDDFHKEPMVCK